MATIEERVAALEAWRLKMDPPVVTEPVPAPTPPTVYTAQRTLGSGAAYTNVVFRRSALALGTVGLVGSGVAGAILTDVLFENLDRGLKVGSGSVSSNLSMTRVKARNCYQGMFLANVHGASLVDIDLESVDKAGTKNHPLYLERDVRELTIVKLRLRGGLGQSLHLYLDTGGWGDGVLIDDVDIVNANHGAAVIQNYRNVTIRTGVLRGVSSEPVFKVYAGVSNVLLQDLDCWGGSFWYKTGSVTNVRRVNCRLNGALLSDASL